MATSHGRHPRLTKWSWHVPHAHRQRTVSYVELLRPKGSPHSLRSPPKCSSSSSSRVSRTVGGTRPAREWWSLRTGEMVSWYLPLRYRSTRQVLPTSLCPATPAGGGHKCTTISLSMPQDVIIFYFPLPFCRVHTQEDHLEVHAGHRGAVSSSRQPLLFSFCRAFWNSGKQIPGVVLRTLSRFQRWKVIRERFQTVSSEVDKIV